LLADRVVPFAGESQKDQGRLGCVCHENANPNNVALPINTGYRFQPGLGTELLQVMADHVALFGCRRAVVGDAADGVRLRASSIDLIVTKTGIGFESHVMILVRFDAI
jgi:hypothetical protein